MKTLEGSAEGSGEIAMFSDDEDLKYDPVFERSLPTKEEDHEQTKPFDWGTVLTLFASTNRSYLLSHDSLQMSGTF